MEYQHTGFFSLKLDFKFFFPALFSFTGNSYFLMVPFYFSIKEVCIHITKEE